MLSDVLLDAFLMPTDNVYVIYVVREDVSEILHIAPVPGVGVVSQNFSHLTFFILCGANLPWCKARCSEN